MAKVIVDDNSLTKIANAIRNTGGTYNSLKFPNGMINAINNITPMSRRISGVITIEEPKQDIITLPNVDLTELQMVHLCRLDDDYPDDQHVQAITAMFRSINVMNAYSLVSLNGTDGSRTTIISDDNFDNWYVYLTMTKYSTSLNVEVDNGTYAAGYFYGRYAYEIFGI